MYDIDEFTLEHLSFSLGDQLSSRIVRERCSIWKDALDNAPVVGTKECIKEMLKRVKHVESLFDRVSRKYGLVLAYNWMLEYISGDRDDDNEFCREL